MDIEALEMGTEAPETGTEAAEKGIAALAECAEAQDAEQEQLAG
jgi:hypothetical protein